MGELWFECLLVSHKGGKRWDVSFLEEKVGSGVGLLACSVLLSPKLTSPLRVPTGPRLQMVSGSVSLPPTLLRHL